MEMKKINTGKILFTRKNKNSPKNSLKFYDKLIFPVSRFLDSLGFKYIVGKNIFVSLKKSQ